jgi:hypothetical protein
MVTEKSGNEVDKEFLSFISGTMEWESPPSFWLLETLTSLRDRAWELVA